MNCDIDWFGVLLVFKQKNKQKKTTTQKPLQVFMPTEQIILIQGTGYLCNEEASSQIRKREETKKLAIAGSHYHAGGTEGGSTTLQVETTESLSNPIWGHGGDGSSGKEAN